MQCIFEHHCVICQASLHIRLTETQVIPGGFATWSFKYKIHNIT